MAIKRHAAGVSITELLVAMVLMGFAFATIGELVVLTTLASTKLTNCIDGVTGANLFLQRLSEDVRAAQTFGSIYSLPQNANSFPDTSNVHDISLASVSHWGGWPTSWPPPPYQLTPQCLILQQPAFYDDSQQVSAIEGAPLMIPAGTISSGVPAVNVQYMDTVVYYVLPDPQAPNQFMIQRARFSGYPNGAQISALQNCALRQLINPPQTVLRGVVGPFDPNNLGGSPTVFQYLQLTGNAPNQTLTPIANPVGSLVPLLSGLSVNIEVETPVPQNGTKIHHVGCHSESFLRANSHIRMSNT